jgi:hypothetical protein
MKTARRIRQAAVAGIFYPGAAAELGRNVDELLAGSPHTPLNVPVPKALVVPHAGSVYSGPIAASACARIVPRRGPSRAWRSSGRRIARVQRAPPSGCGRARDPAGCLARGTLQFNVIVCEPAADCLDAKVSLSKRLGSSVLNPHRSRLHVVRG